jgi:hypothetical protein
MTRVIAIDWSGARVGAHRKIWIAEARDGDLVRLESGRSRKEVTAWLIEEAARGEPLVVGIDFAFSTPQWFLAEKGMATAHELWREAEQSADKWLKACEPPFWGRPGKKRNVEPEKRLRRTEMRTPEMKAAPKSVFQIGGAGAVGTGSLQGMPKLLALQEAGFCVWPFDDVVSGRSVVVEIYPRVWSQGVTKTRPEACLGFITPERFPGLSAEFRKKASENEDSFDAAVSALGMDAERAGLAALPRIDDPQLRAEGIIWGPGWREVVGA